MAINRGYLGQQEDLAGDGGYVNPVDKQLAKDHPILEAFLRDAEWEDGEVRQTGSIFFFCDDGCWKACVNDRHCSLKAFFTGKGFLDLLRKIESALSKGAVEWRRDTAKSKRK